MTPDEARPLIVAVVPLVLGGLGWQALRYRVPPELIALVATLGLPLAGLWNSALVPFALTPSSWLSLGGLLALSIVALRKLPRRSTADLFLVGLLGGALPGAYVAALEAKDARSAGRLAVVAAGGAAMSPVGGPIQLVLAGGSLDWWLASAPAGALAAAICWGGNELGREDAPPTRLGLAAPNGAGLDLARVRWLIAVCWAGVVMQMSGAPWALSRLTESPPEAAPWLWALVAWVAGNLVDPWLTAEFGGRAVRLGAEGGGLDAAIAALTIPNLAVLVVAWGLTSWRAVWAGLPAVFASLALVLLLV